MTINARTDNSIPDSKRRLIIQGTCTKEKTGVNQALADPETCPGIVDNYEKAGKIISRLKDVGPAVKRTLADWLAEKESYTYPKVLVLIESMPKGNKAMAREMGALALAAVLESKDPNERTAGTVAVAEAYLERQDPEAAGDTLASLGDVQCAKKSCYDNSVFKGLVDKLVDQRLAEKAYGSAVGDADRLPASAATRAGLYLKIAGSMPGKAKKEIVQQVLDLADEQIKRVNSKADKKPLTSQLKAIKVGLK